MLSEASPALSPGNGRMRRCCRAVGGRSTAALLAGGGDPLLIMRHPQAQQDPKMVWRSWHGSAQWHDLRYYS
jgi:hypothetical protein